jgi:menaquinone-dependent protoporphyrinogen oxidase
MKSIIIYATRYGSAAQAAGRIQKELSGNCTLVNIMTDNVPSLETFDTVILGGSIYIGKVQKELTTFAGANLKQLLSKKVGLYLCAGAQKQEERDKELQGAFPLELLAHAVTKDVLGYAFAFEKMRFFDRLIMKKIKGDAVSTAEYFDERISQFAKALTAK